MSSTRGGMQCIGSHITARRSNIRVTLATSIQLSSRDLSCMRGAIQVACTLCDFIWSRNTLLRSDAGVLGIFEIKILSNSRWLFSYPNEQSAVRSLQRHEHSQRINIKRASRFLIENNVPEGNNLVGVTKRRQFGRYRCNVRKFFNKT